MPQMTTPDTPPDNRDAQDGSAGSLPGWVGWGIFLLFVGALILTRMLGVSC